MIVVMRTGCERLPKRLNHERASGCVRKFHEALWAGPIALLTTLPKGVKDHLAECISRTLSAGMPGEPGLASRVPRPNSYTMQNFPHTVPKFHRVLSLVYFILGLGMSQGVSAQAFVNGDFENDTLGWSGCINEIGTAVTYGGVGTNKVAEVDGNFSTSSTDDRVLCQTIPGFTVGGVYRLEFQATRRGDSSAPDTVAVTMTMDNDALYRTVTRSGGYAMVAEGFEFTATSTTHLFEVRPNFQGPFGMVFDNFTITYLYILPIELISFTGEAFTDGVHLNWVTATERDNSHFTVQRSTDGLEFHDVVEVVGAGNSQVQHNYTVVDPSPIPGLAYYRLEQTDIQGVETLFTIVPVRFERSQQKGLAVFPNPSTNGQLWLAANGLAKEVTVPVSITDLQGRLIHREVITLSPGIAVELDQYVALNEGMYLVSIPSTGNPQSIRVIVQ